jgi:hypothetical protein
MLRCAKCDRPQPGPCPFCIRGASVRGKVIAGVSTLILAACYGPSAKKTADDAGVAPVDLPAQAPAQNAAPPPAPEGVKTTRPPG